MPPKATHLKRQEVPVLQTDQIFHLHVSKYGKNWKHFHLCILFSNKKKPNQTKTFLGPQNCIEIPTQINEIVSHRGKKLKKKKSNVFIYIQMFCLDNLNKNLPGFFFFILIRLNCTFISFGLKRIFKIWTKPEKSLCSVLDAIRA